MVSCSVTWTALMQVELKMHSPLSRGRMESWQRQLLRRMNIDAGMPECFFVSRSPPLKPVSRFPGSAVSLLLSQLQLQPPSRVFLPKQAMDCTLFSSSHLPASVALSQLNRAHHHFSLFPLVSLLPFSSLCLCT